ncbi:MAG: queuosine salvage family protein [Dehalococcoidia bacterium]|nr:queuosine salvage family protein [Dehalococcoidia bacterium]
MTLGVRESTAWVMERARHVAIDDRAIDAIAARLATSALAPPPWNTRYHLTGDRATVAQYLLLLDTLNFCFWGEPRWTIAYQGETLNGYRALAAALTRAVAEGRLSLDARALATVSEATLADVFRGSAEIPLFAERLRLTREMGAALARDFDGQAVNVIAAADGSAIRLVQIVAETIPSFNDVTTYDGQPVRFFKRAQILAADLAGAGVAVWRDLADLTAFADYKVPQVLRALGALRYAPSLADRVARRELLPPGSPEEVEIRAATVQAVERLRAAFARQGLALTASAIDWLLWDAGQRPLAHLEPYHRTRTIFY